MGILTGGPMSPGGLLTVAGVAIDPDVATFFAAMDTASEPYWQSEKIMLNNLVTALKTDGVWGLFTLLWFPVGESLTGAMRALKHPSGVGFKMQNNGFVAGKWSRLTGLDSLDRAGYIDTLSQVQDYSPITNFHAAIWAEEGGGGYDIANDNSFTPSFIFSSAIYRPGNYTYNFPVENTVGWIAGSTKNSQVKLWKNAVLKGTLSVNPSEATVQSAATYRIFRGRDTQTSERKLSMASIGRGFTDAQHATVYNAFSAARTARGQLTA